MDPPKFDPLTPVENEMVLRYHYHRVLAELGFTARLETLPSELADAFVLIHGELTADVKK
jgi:hypothetical protein